MGHVRAGKRCRPRRRPPFEDEIAVVLGGLSGRVVLHRDDRGHDERGIFPAGSGVGGAAVRFAVDDPDACERDVAGRGLTVV
jgi:hypothetical protein